MTAAAVSTRYRVRKMTSGRTGSVSYYVYDLVRQGRVSVHAAPSRTSAQLDADDLNIADMVRDHADDPRPYQVRRAEARATYYAARSA